MSCNLALVPVVQVVKDFFFLFGTGEIDVGICEGFQV